MKLPKITDLSSVHIDTQNLLSDSATALSQRSVQLQALLNANLTRNNTNLGSSLPVILSLARLEPDTLNEWMQLQSAIAERFMEQNQQWLAGMQQIAGDAGQIKKANTLSKFMEQQCDIVGQWVALVSTQSTNMMGQLENIQVDIGYWMAQKAQG